MVVMDYSSGKKADSLPLSLVQAIKEIEADVQEEDGDSSAHSTIAAVTVIFELAAYPDEHQHAARTVRDAVNHIKSKSMASIDAIFAKNVKHSDIIGSASGILARSAEDDVSDSRPEHAKSIIGARTTCHPSLL